MADHFHDGHDDDDTIVVVDDDDEDTIVVVDDDDEDTIVDDRVAASEDVHVLHRIHRRNRRPPSENFLIYFNL